MNITWSNKQQRKYMGDIYGAKIHYIDDDSNTTYCGIKDNPYWDITEYDSLVHNSNVCVRCMKALKGDK